MSVADLTQAVALQESARLMKVPGIGKKTAERLLLELKGKLAPALPSAAGSAATVDAGADIVRALMALGYSEREAAAALRLLPPDIAVSEGIRQALRQLGKV
jgi:Holliday junction DNA helicase RuvA